MSDYQPTDEQITALARTLYSPDGSMSLDDQRAHVQVVYLEDARATCAAPSFQAIVRSAQAEAWKRGAQWAAVEVDVIVDEAQGWATDEDNPYTEGSGS